MVRNEIAGPPLLVVLMGVSGAGKSAAGMALAERRGYAFIDADDYHSADSVDRMARGVPLTEAERGPWLERIAAALDHMMGPTVLACSALRQQHRQRLRQGRSRVIFVHLHGPAGLLARRLRARQRHFFDSDLLQSQLETLEPPGPDEALTVPIDRPLAAVVDEIHRRLGRRSPAEEHDMKGDSERGCDLGLVGLGVMGAALADNLHRNGVRVAGMDLDPGRRDAFAVAPVGREGKTCTSLAELTAALARPRRLLLMVAAGAPVDAVLDELSPLLEPGDLVMDGGNSHFADSERRAERWHGLGLEYLGLGISGGEQGARRGPSIMAGGSEAAWELARPLLEAVAARAGDEPCLARLGDAGAGHYVKMVHNAIEYAEMQLIAEVYHLLRVGAGMELPRLAAMFRQWAEGPLSSYLLEITAAILTHADPATGQPLLDLISDESRHLGTGRWACETALGLGVPAPTLQAALDARYLSSLGEQRRLAADRLPGPSGATAPLDDALLTAAADAFAVARLAAFAQGFALLAAARQDPGYAIDGAVVARTWRAGCILRARLLQPIAEAFGRQPDLPNLLLDAELGAGLEPGQDALRRVTALAAAHGLPAPALASSLAYYDGYRCARLPANLTAAQRDCFGAHGFGRVDRAGQHHAAWPCLDDDA